MNLLQLVNKVETFIAQWAGTTTPRIVIAFLGILICRRRVMDGRGRRVAEGLPPFHPTFLFHLLPLQGTMGRPRWHHGRRAMASANTHINRRSPMSEIRSPRPEIRCPLSADRERASSPEPRAPSPDYDHEYDYEHEGNK